MVTESLHLLTLTFWVEFIWQESSKVDKTHIAQYQGAFDWNTFSPDIAQHSHLLAIYAFWNTYLQNVALRLCLRLPLYALSFVMYVNTSNMCVCHVTQTIIHQSINK